MHAGDVLGMEDLGPLSCGQFYQLAKDRKDQRSRLNGILLRQRAVTSDTALRLPCTVARHLTSGSIFRPNMIWRLPIAPCGSASNGNQSHGLLERQNARTRRGISEIRRGSCECSHPSFLTGFLQSQQLLPRLATNGPLSRTPRIRAVNAFRRSSAASCECQPGARPTSSRPRIQFQSAVEEPSSPHPQICTSSARRHSNKGISTTTTSARQHHDEDHAVIVPIQQASECSWNGVGHTFTPLDASMSSNRVCCQVRRQRTIGRNGTTRCPVNRPIPCGTTDQGRVTVNQTCEDRFARLAGPDVLAGSGEMTSIRKCGSQLCRTRLRSSVPMPHSQVNSGWASGVAP